jgi:hypothetical protein
MYSVDLNSLPDNDINLIKDADFIVLSSSSGAAADERGEMDWIISRVAFGFDRSSVL